MVDTLHQDLRFAIRQLARRPGLSASAILSLAIGIAVNTVAFSAINAFFIKGNAGTAVDGTGWVFTTPRPDASQTSLPEFEHLAAAAGDALVTAAEGRIPLARRHQGGSDTVWSLLISPHYLPLLEAKPIAGRLPSARDGATAVVVGERFWRERLDAAALANLRITLNGVDCEIVGVLPESFRGPGGTYAPEIWVPLAARRELGLPERLETRTHRWLTMIARRQPGVTTAEADARLRAGARAMAEAYPDSHETFTAGFYPMSSGFPGSEGRLLRWVATGAMAGVGVVLLLACFNVASLLLARAIDREREMGIRAALGASQRRLIRQLITEGMVLAGAAGALSLVVASWSQELLGAFALPSPIPQRIDVSPDATVVGFAALLVLLAGVVPGIAPARHGARVNLVHALSSQSPGAAGGRPSWGRQGLVILQVTGSTLLLTLALLFVQSFIRVGSADPGFERERVLVVEMDPALQNYDPARARLLVDRLAEAIGAQPGVERVAVADRIPFYVGFRRLTPATHGSGSCADGKCPAFATYAIGRGFFSAMAIPLGAGREFDGPADAPSGVIVSETFARNWWPQGNAVGQVLRLGLDGATRGVIGVARDTKHHGFSESPVAAIYLPISESDFASRVTIVARTTAAPGPLVPVVRQAAYEVDPAVPPVSTKTMEQWLEGPRYPARTGTGFFGVCGLLALVLATTGLFGVISHTVRQRTREFGVRIAVGAGRGALVRSVLWSSGRLVGPGLLFGLAGAALVAQAIRVVFVGVDVTGPTTYLAVAAVQSIVALAACLAPALRAGRVDPILALRSD